MAASFTTTRVDLFPNGTSVGAYLRSNWTKAERDKGPTGAPTGSAAATATMTNGSATLTGLAYDTDYFLVGQVSGVYVYSRFHTQKQLTSSVSGGGVTAVVALTQAEYDALASKDATTLYVISG